METKVQKSERSLKLRHQKIITLPVLHTDFIFILFNIKYSLIMFVAELYLILIHFIGFNCINLLYATMKFMQIHFLKICLLLTIKCFIAMLKFIKLLNSCCFSSCVYASHEHITKVHNEHTELYAMCLLQ